MATQSFKFFTPRDKPKKRGPRQHKKSLNIKREASSKRNEGTRTRLIMNSLIRIVTNKADELAIQYNKTKDPALRRSGIELVRSLGNCQPYDNETSDTILRSPPGLRKKPHHQIK